MVHIQPFFKDFFPFIFMLISSPETLCLDDDMRKNLKLQKLKEKKIALERKKKGKNDNNKEKEGKTQEINEK